MGTLPDLAAASAARSTAPAARPHWLTAERLTVYPLIVVAVTLASAIGWIVASGGMVDPRGKPLGYDFITFWGASYLALGGAPAAAYDMVRIAGDVPVDVEIGGQALLTLSL